MELESTEIFKNFTTEDYLNTTKPFEALYKFKDDKFTMERMSVVASQMAKKAGISNFKSLFKAYCDSLKKSTKASIMGNVTAFTGQELELDSGKWHADDFGVSRESANEYGEIQACVHPIMPVQRLVNIDTNTEKLKIAYRKGGIWRHVIADRETLSSNKIISLSNSGIAVNSENCRHLISYLHDIENINYDIIPEAKSIGRLGWIEGHGFSPYDEELLFDGEASYKKIFTSVKEHGSLKGWKEVAGVCRKNLYARLVLDASFASALVQPLGTLPFFVHMWGSKSGTGKTVALMLATSVWANPKKGNYWSTFDSTGVGQELTAGFLNSMPLILDELQLVKDKKNFDKTVYSLAEGVGRTRGAKTGGLQNTATWGNTIITTGEMPMTGFSSGAGAINRIIELNCNKTIIANGPKVSAALCRHYGFAGHEFVEWLQKDGNMAIAEKAFNLYSEELAKTDATEKQTMAAALLLTADALISSLFFEDKPLKAEDIASALKSDDDLDLCTRAYEFITSKLAMNSRHFDPDNEGNTEMWGLDDDEYYYIIRSKFTELCEEGDFNDKAVLNIFKENEYIMAQKGCTKAKKMFGSTINCVFLKKPDNLGFREIDEEEEAEKPPF